jgi:type I restriction enzyme S subunit
MVPLGEVLIQVQRPETPIVGQSYRQIGVKLWGVGAYERETIDGAQTKYATLSRVEADDVIVNKIWARNGSVAVVPAHLEGAYVSNEFPLFRPTSGKVCPRWIHWLTKTKPFWERCEEKSRGTSGQNRIRPEKFLQVVIPLPPFSEQQRIVERIEVLAAKIDEARGLRREVENDLNRMLASAFARVIEDAPMRAMADVAPLVRRPVTPDREEWHELGVRSFGKGTFHKPPINITEVGSKKLFFIEEGDLLFNIVFAWEGAVAVAKSQDAGRVGSHRFLTCVPQQGVATSNFLRFYFLTNEGLTKLMQASPGGAGRNRTLGLKALEALTVPVPSFNQQLWFDKLQAKSDAIKTTRAETSRELDALLPSVLDRAFTGRL